MQDHGQERLIVVVKDERDLPVGENKSFPAVRSDWDVEAILSGNDQHLPRQMNPESRQLDSGGDQSEVPRERPLRKRADLLCRETVPASSAGDDPGVAMRVMAEQYLPDLELMGPRDFGPPERGAGGYLKNENELA